MGARAGPGANQGGGPGRDLQAGPAGRAALGGGREVVLRLWVLQPQALRPDPGGALQAGPQARSGDRALRGVVRHRPGAPRARPERAQPLGDPGVGHLHAAPGPGRAGLPPRRPGPLRQPAHPLRRRADPEPGARGAEPHGAGGARAHDHTGRGGDHSPEPDQHPPGGGGDQGVLRDQPAFAVHGPAQPAIRAGAQAAPLCPGPRRPVQGAGWVRGS